MRCECLLRAVRECDVVKRVSIGFAGRSGRLWRVSTFSEEIDVQHGQCCRAAPLRRCSQATLRASGCQTASKVDGNYMLSAKFVQPDEAIQDSLMQQVLGRSGKVGLQNRRPFTCANGSCADQL